jgi:capsular exopolysaccharide synthesis family protein
VDLKQYVRVLRTHWVWIAACVTVCVVLALVYALTRTPVYAADSQLFVSNDSSAGLNDTYAGSLFTQQRITTYAEVVSSPAVAAKVIKALDLPYTVPQLRSEIQAVVPTGTVLIDVTVTDSSPQRAASIANAVDEQFSAFVKTLETPVGSKASSVKVAVTSPPQVSASPVSPRKSLYVVFGVILGLVFGIGGAVVLEAFKKEVGTEDRAEAIVDAPLLGATTDQVPEELAKVVSGDARPAEAEEYRRLRTNLSARSGSRRPPRSFVVSSAVEGEGKTEIAATLAVTFAQSGSRVVLVDANPRESGLAELMSVSPTPSLVDVVEQRVPLEVALQRPSKRGLSLEVLAGGLNPATPRDPIGSDGIWRVLDKLTNRADIVIVDAPPILTSMDAVLLAQLTAGVVLVTRIRSTRVDELEAAAQTLATAGARVLGIVSNRSAGGREGSVASRFRALVRAARVSRLMPAPVRAPADPEPGPPAATGAPRLRSRG